MLSKNCLVCGIIFFKPPTLHISIWNSQRKFCNRTCFYKFQERPKRVCEFCEMEFIALSTGKRGSTGRQRFCSHQCYAKSILGKPNKSSGKFKKGNIPPFKGKRFPHVTGEKNNHWKGGITKLHEKIRKLPEYKLWRQTIFIRDDYTCQNCDIRGGDKHVDHIKQFALILQENKITTIEEALKCSQLWDINNGRTLCVPCHKQTDTYLKKLIIVT